MEQTFASLPADEDLVPHTDLKGWAQKARMFLQEAIKTDQSSGAFADALEALRRRMASLESSLLGGTTESEARKAFITWVREKSTEGAWAYYAAKKVEADRLKAVEEARKTHALRIDRARSEAIKLRNTPAVMGSAYGTVVAGLSDTASDDYWIGTSGAYTRADQQHPVMRELLADVGQAEAWPVEACAEVDAMNQYLIARGFTRKNQIPLGTLYFHAETWNYEASKWQSRKTCGNCSAWIKKIDGRRC
ncbi:hypothetical protein ACQPYK_02485 [Streptosporangium sp. CA-135522]|uniref:hypothetical protein n=1 Tax=Streptosporangium sp. CA-135522 TaxID=3240072 RepID=UPI003D8B5419